MPIAGVTFHAQYIYKLAEMMVFRFFILRQTHILFWAHMGDDRSVGCLWFSPHVTIGKSAATDPQTDPNHHKEGKWNVVRCDGPVHFSNPTPPREIPSVGS